MEEDPCADLEARFVGPLGNLLHPAFETHDTRQRGGQARLQSAAIGRGRIGIRIEQALEQGRPRGQQRSDGRCRDHGLGHGFQHVQVGLEESQYAVRV